MLGAMVYEDIRMYRKGGNFVIEYTGTSALMPSFSKHGPGFRKTNMMGAERGLVAC